MEILTSREWAIIIWALALLLFSARKKDVRDAFINVLRAAASRHIVRYYLILGSYVGLVVLGLSYVGLWQLDQLKPTILWVILAATLAGFRAATQDSLPNLFVVWVKDTLTLTVLIEFLVTNYTLPLWIELALVPLLFVVGCMIALAGNKPEYRQTKAVLEGFLTLIGVLLILRGVYLLIGNWDAFATLRTARDIYTPPLLGLTIIPFIYIAYLYSQYEQGLTRLKFAIPDRKLRDYALSMAILTFGPRTNLLRRWIRDTAANKPDSKADIVNSMSVTLKYGRREKSLPQVDPEDGWCPVKAGLFLEDEGLKTNDYHESYGDWFASSPMRELNNYVLPDNLAYYVEGNADAATCLKLKLNVNSEEDVPGSETTLLIALQKLIERATGYYAMHLQLKKSREELAKIDFGDGVLKWRHEPHLREGYSLVASIVRGSSSD